MPVSTSPIPALAMPGFPEVLMCQLPVGSQTNVPAPFNATWAWYLAATAVAALNAVRLHLPGGYPEQPRGLRRMRREERRRRARGEAGRNARRPLPARFSASASSTRGSGDSSAQSR